MMWCAASLQPVIFGNLMAHKFELIKMFKKIKKEETSSDKSLLSQLMQKFRLSLLGTVLSQLKESAKPSFYTALTESKNGFEA